jgi:hypothetical protein
LNQSGVTAARLEIDRPSQNCGLLSYCHATTKS